MEYWTWWIGAIALGFFTVFYSLFTGKPLGVSGSWLSIARRKDDAILKASIETLARDPNEIKDELMAMTMAEFGEDFAQDEFSTDTTKQNEFDSSTVKITAAGAKLDFTPWTVHAFFLGSMFLGSYLASLSTGEYSLSLELSAMHARIFENTGEAWIALFFGGMMVGFGTQMAGGCTSGHGLSGCAQLIPASLMSTAVFFGSGTALTLLMNFRL